MGKRRKGLVVPARRRQLSKRSVVKAGAWYYFDSYGYALRNQWKYIKGLWYYFGDDCRMVKGWIKLGSHWYYLNPTAGAKPEGAMLTGLQKIGSYWYFLRPARDGNHLEGSAATEWIRDDVYWYYLLPEKKGSKPECSMALGWEQIGGEVVLFQSGQELSGNRIDDALSLDHEREQAVLSEVRRCDGGK